MKKYLGIVFSLLLAVSLLMVPAAVSADPGDLSFQEDGKGVVEWSTENPHSGDYSVRLELPAPVVGDEDEARIKFSYDGTLATLSAISFWGKVDEDSTASSLQASPYITYSMDMNDDGVPDAWGVHSNIVYSPRLMDGNEWTKMEFGEECYSRIASVVTGGPTGDEWYVFGPVLLSELRTLLQPDGRPWNECTILEIKVGVGTMGDSLETVIAFVDDVTINGQPFDLEAPSGTVEMIATYPAPVIGIEVSPGSVSFGDVYPGDASDPETVTVTNTGNIVEDFSASIIHEDPTGVYTAPYPDGLTMEGPGVRGSVSAWEALGVLPANPPEGTGTAGSVEPSLVLTVPEGTSYGTYHATLIFWAEMAE